MRTRSMLDARCLALHRLVVDKVRGDPVLFDQVRSTLSRWRTMVDARSQSYLLEWEALVALGMGECLALAVEESERAAVLRKSSPFAGILTDEERVAFLSSWHGQEKC
jgi:hypothetical protein